MTDFSSAAMDLEADVGRAREAILQLTDWIGKLQDRVAVLEAQQQPTPVPLVTGPPWPTTAVLRGSAPTRTAGNITTVTLRPRTVDTGAASDGHDLHLVLPEPITRYTWAVDLTLGPAMLDALTWKFGGMASFDGDWARWPAGNTSANTTGTTNTMERLVGSNTTEARWPADARYGVYATFPTVVAEIPTGRDGVTATIGGARAWVTNGGHTCHWEIDHPATTLQAHHERRVDTNARTLRHLINGVEVIALTGLPWPGGMNRVYVSCMIGGSSPEFLPRTPDRTGTLTYSRFELTRG